LLIQFVLSSGMFEWDEEKNRQNLAKHGIRFEEASLIFEGPVMS
jgi:uncharacterized DUF497 family protein